MQTLDWRNPLERDQVCRMLQQHAQDSTQGPKAPLLIKHAVSHWPALQRWNLQHLPEAYSDQRYPPPPPPPTPSSLHERITDHPLVSILVEATLSKLHSWKACRLLNS